MDESEEYFGLLIAKHASIVFCCYQPCCRGLRGKKTEICCHRKEPSCEFSVRNITSLSAKVFPFVPSLCKYSVECKTPNI